MQRIWCPGCGCDVRGLLESVSARAIEDLRQLAREKKARGLALKLFREVVAAMEVHAEAQGATLRPVADIYRLWSHDVLTEVKARFHEEPEAVNAVAGDAE